jgi:hypothetical protein
VLPPLFDGWIGALLPGPIPRETKATCGACAMWPKPGEARDAERHYAEETKCCTFLPALANFLVGGALDDRDPSASHGRATVEERIGRGVGVTPFGLERTPVYSALYRSSPLAFGRAKAMRCPHYLEEEGGLCGVWRHRESTCATWFCKYERGEVGRLFWQRVHDLLAAVELALARHCVLSLEFDAASLAALFPSRMRKSLSATHDGLSAADLDGVVAPAHFAALWGPWLGREREFYSKCRAIVEGLAWSEIASLGGSEIELLARLLKDAYVALTSAELPARLERRSLKIVYSSPDRAEIVGYSDLDALRVPKELVEVLHCFDGGDTRETIERISDEHGLALTDSLVRTLVDFSILGAPR